MTDQGSDPTGGQPAEVILGPVVLGTAAETVALGVRLAQLLRAGDLVVLSGGLGAGKTTLTQGLGTGLGVRGDVTSPTFVLSRVHPSLDRGPDLVHVDAYRLGSLDEVDDLDLDASLADSVTVVEWGAGRVEALAADRLVVEVVRAEGSTADESRTVTLRGQGPRWSDAAVVAALAAVVGPAGARARSSAAAPDRSP